MLDLDYRVLRIIYTFNGRLKVGEIARKLSIPHSTVGSCVKRLEDEKYVKYERYKPVNLLDKGKNLAIELIRHSQLLEVLLFEELELSIEAAHSEAEKFNLLFSCDTINKICEKYEHPKACPCGELILNSTECACEEKQ